MNKASKIKIAKQLIHYARMVLDAEQLDNMKIAGDNASIVRNAIRHYFPDIFEYAEENNVSTTNFVFHHLQGTSTKHYVGTNAPQLKSKQIAEDIRHALMLNSTEDFHKRMVNNYIKRNQNSKRNYRNINIQYLQNLKKEVELQVDNCIILPKKFHDWIHHQIEAGNGIITIKNTGETIDISNRKSCYELLNKYRSDKKRLTELINENFDNASLFSAIKSFFSMILLFA